MSEKKEKKAEVAAKQLKSSIMNVETLPKKRMILMEAKKGEKDLENHT